MTGKTHFEYIRSLRLSQAAVKIRDEDIRIIDAALDFVFETPEGFTRAFAKEFGMTPRYYSKNTPPLRLFMPNRIRDYYLTFQKGESTMSEKPRANTIFVQVIERPARKLILKRGINATYYKKGTSQYTQGVEVPKDYSGEVPEGFDLIDLPPCKMMVLHGQTKMDLDFSLHLWDIEVI